MLKTKRPGGHDLAPQSPDAGDLALRPPDAGDLALQPPAVRDLSPQPTDVVLRVLIRPLCPGPVNRSVRALDHRLVAPEVPALQHRLLAPVDKLPHLPELVPGGLLLLHDDGDVLPPPDDEWATRKGTFFVVASVSLTRMARGSRHTTFPEPFLVPTLAATRHWRCLPPGLKLPCQPTWNRFSSRQNTSQADVSVKSGPDHQSTQQPCIHQELSSDSKPRSFTFYVLYPFQKLMLESIYDYFTH